MSEPDETETGTDPVFGFTAGVYAAAVFAPAVTILAATSVTDDPAALIFSFLGSVVSFAALAKFLPRK